jgi:hypothetical protein
MATQNISTSNTENFRYTVRSSYYYQATHINDNFKNLGYNYAGNVLKNSTSDELWSNPMQVPLYKWLEALIVTWFNQTKIIKKLYSIAHHKNTNNIN